MFYENNRMLEEFEQQNCKVVVFNRPFGKKLTAPYKALDMPYAVVQKFISLLFMVVVPFFRSMAFLVNNNIDLVHLNNCSMSGQDWLFAAKLLGKKCITHDRGYAVFSRMSLFGAKHFDKIICVANWVKERLITCGIPKYKVSVLYDGIDVVAFEKRVHKTKRQIRAEFSIALQAPLIGLIGNIQEWKGQHYAIRAMGIVQKKYKNITMIIAGAVSQAPEDVEYMSLLKLEVKRLGLEESIVFAGFRSDVPDIMNACDIILHTSTIPEPLGMVLLEAMALKKTVIATHFGGPKEIIEEGVSGFLIPPQNPEKLAEKIDQLLLDETLRSFIGNNAAVRVQTIFNMRQFGTNLKRMYGELL